MNEPAVQEGSLIPAMTDDQESKVKALAAKLKELPQVRLETIHTLHDGVYTRTVLTPAGVMGAGVKIKIPTTLIVSGDATAIIGDETHRITGYHVFTAMAPRQQAFFAHSDTWVTMIFKTSALTVEEAEAEFTDETDQLMSRHPDAINTVLQGALICQEPLQQRLFLQPR